jgi:[protein-PII] uridylyltransferase
VLSLHNLSVLNAQVFTWKNGCAVDVLEVRAEDSIAFSEMDWQSLGDDLNLALNHRLGLGHRLYKKLSNTYGKRKLPSGVADSRVLLDNEASQKYTVIEVYSTDSPGQLYRITQTLADFGLVIYRAYIATEVEQLIDVFYVLDAHGEKVTDVAFMKELRDGILYGMGIGV